MPRHLFLILLAVSCLCRSLPTAHAASYTFTTFDVPGSITTAADGINTAGQIVGRFRDAGLHGFLKDGATFTTIDVPGATSTEAHGINDRGQITGIFFDTAGGLHSFLKDGATSTQAFGIGASGQIVGQFLDATGYHGFLTTDGATFTTIDVPGATSTQAREINTAGQIMGTFSDTIGLGLHGFVTDGATFTTIDVPGAAFTEALGINDRGQIVGFYGDGSGRADGFLATPQVIAVTIDIKPGSEPATINPKSQGVIPVAILTTDTFDATTVNAGTVRFGKTGAGAAIVRSALEDVDGDGDTDLLLDFTTQDTGIQCGDTSASLTGETADGQPIQGSDAIVTTGCKK